jgi:hypothetical protein
MNSPSSPVATPAPILDLEGLSFEYGAYLLVNQAMANLSPGTQLGIRGTDPALSLHLAAWCRQQGHQVQFPNPDDVIRVTAWVVRGSADLARWQDAERAGGPAPTQIVTRPTPHWGLAARGALVEAGGPDLGFDLDNRDVVWADMAPKLYAQAVASQWDPATAIGWDAEFNLPPEVEAAVVQVMTYLVENEQAALSSNCSQSKQPTRPATSRSSHGGHCSRAGSSALRRLEAEHHSPRC